jgi:hypothetical protein
MPTENHINIDPNDPRLDIPIQPPKLTNAHARSLYALGLYDKAMRRSYCGARQYRRCPEHHEHMRKIGRSCMLRTCDFCADRQVFTFSRRFRRRHAHLLKIAKYRLLLISGPVLDHIPSSEELESFADPIYAWLLQHLDPRPGTGAISNRVVEQLGDSREYRITLRLIWYGTLTDRAIREAAEFGKLDITSHAPGTLYSRLEDLLTYAPPTHPDDAALLEFSLQGIRMLRCHGQMMRKNLLNPEDALNLSEAEAELSVTNMTPNPPPPTDESSENPPLICGACGGGLTEVSEWVLPDQSVTDFESLSWRREAPPPMVQ